MRTLPVAGRLYVLGVTCAAAFVLLGLLGRSVDWGVNGALICLYAFFEIVSLSRVNRSINFSLAFPIALASVLLVPPVDAALISGAGMALGAIPRRAAPVKRMFNVSVCVVSAFLAGEVYAALDSGGALTASVFPAVLGPVVCAALVFCLTNAGLLAGILYATEGSTVSSVWRGSLSRTVGSYLGFGMFGLMFAVLWSSSFGPLSAVLVLLPLSVARWGFAQYAREQEAYDAAVRALVQAVEIKDGYTRGHSERVAKAAVMIGKRVGMGEDRLASVEYAGLLHDVGKLGVPTRLLCKAGPLTDDEYQVVQLHPVRGVEMISDIRFLREVYAGILHHHERLDGRGYPLGLAGDEIPEFARVLAVADAFDSMTSARSYRAARPVAAAMDELRRCEGRQFDTHIVDALVAAVGEDGWQAGVVTTAGSPEEPARPAEPRAVRGEGVLAPSGRADKPGGRAAPHRDDEAPRGAPLLDDERRPAAQQRESVSAGQGSRHEGSG